jgi:hypothetical protein
MCQRGNCPFSQPWAQANRRQKLGLVCRNRKKISQIINAYPYLPFFLLLILWVRLRETVEGRGEEGRGIGIGKKT